MGSQRSVGFAPDRWLIIQEVINLVPKLAIQVKDELPSSLQLYRGGPGRFPMIRILRRDGAERLSNLLAKTLVEQGVSGLPVRSQPPALKASIFRYITALKMSSDEIDEVDNSKFWSESTMQPLLLLRSLIAEKLLSFAISKRWRVTYGLDNTRNPPTKTAVPYR